MKHDRGKPCHYHIRSRVTSHVVADGIVVTGLAPVMGGSALSCPTAPITSRFANPLVSISTIKKPQAHRMPRDDTCLRWPGATTSYSMKRGSTLLLHSVKPLIRSNSEVPFIRPESPTCTIRRLSAIPNELLLFIIAEYLYFCTKLL